MSNPVKTLLLNEANRVEKGDQKFLVIVTKRDEKQKRKEKSIKEGVEKTKESQASVVWSYLSRRIISSHARTQRGREKNRSIIFFHLSIWAATRISVAHRYRHHPATNPLFSASSSSSSSS